MAARDVLGSVCDRLVGGMMFHSDNADLCRLMGVEWLAELHDDGFLHDAKAHAKVRRLAILHTRGTVASGRQDRTHTLDQWRKVRACDITHEQRMVALRDAMDDWCEWEESAAETFRAAYSRMLDCGHAAIAKRLLKLAEDTEDELAEARLIRAEMDACAWDMPHVMEMRR